jgi:hypothetical protein
MSAKKANPLAGMASTMTDGMDMMRRMWGMTGLPQIPTASGIAQFAQGLPQALPSMITPTLDTGELDKRIADLRAVEQWLNLNATMLRTTIQTLEVQRNTIATLKSFGGSVLASMNARGSGGEAKAPLAAAPSDSSGSDWPPQRVRHEMPAPAAQPPAPEPRAAAPRAPRKGKTAAAGGAKAIGAMPINAAAWWGALQDQFARVAAAAVTPPSQGAGKAAAGKAPAARLGKAGKSAKAPVAPRARRKASAPTG